MDTWILIYNSYKKGEKSARHFKMSYRITKGDQNPLFEFQNCSKVWCFVAFIIWLSNWNLRRFTSDSPPFTFSFGYKAVATHHTDSYLHWKAENVQLFSCSPLRITRYFIAQHPSATGAWSAVTLSSLPHSALKVNQSSCLSSWFVWSLNVTFENRIAQLWMPEA